MSHQTFTGSCPDPAAIRVAYDIRVLQGEDACRGMGHYTRGLVEALLKRGGSDDKTPLKLGLIIDKERPEPCLKNSETADFIPVASPWPASGRLSISERFRKGTPDLRDVKKALVRWGADILHLGSPLHGPFNWEPLEGLRMVATVYDLIPLRDRAHYLDVWPAKARERYEGRLENLMALDAVLAISKTAGRELLELTGAPSERVHVAYPALRDVFSERGAEPLPQGDGARRSGPVLGFASLNPSKNTEVLLEAFGRLAPEMRRKNRLLLMGPDDGDLRDYLGSKFKEFHIEADADFVAEPDDALLLESYSEAAVFVIPSRFEGFGIPAIEAMACGAPVIASDIEVLREVIQDGGLYFPSNSPNALAGAMDKTLSGMESAALRAEAGKRRAEGFSWALSAEVVAKVYQGLKVA